MIHPKTCNRHQTILILEKVCSDIIAYILACAGELYLTCREEIIVPGCHQCYRLQTIACRIPHETLRQNDEIAILVGIILEGDLHLIVGIIRTENNRIQQISIHVCHLNAIPVCALIYVLIKLQFERFFKFQLRLICYNHRRCCIIHKGNIKGDKLIIVF